MGFPNTIEHLTAILISLEKGNNIPEFDEYHKEVAEEIEVAIRLLSSFSYKKFTADELEEK